jgi:glycosyltransferase involved in cell wall biosynthesis
MRNNYKFSVLLPVYKNVSFILFLRAYNSIIKQNLKANEIIILIDGPVDLKIKKFLKKKKKKIIIFNSKKNVGLGKILKIGVNISRYNIIARADADDYSLPDRFKTQINFFKKNPKIDILSSSVEEVSGDIIYGIRKLPSKHSCIIKMMKFRNPINHSSVIFRKRVVIKCGNYLDLKNFEDYFLWVRAFKFGAKFANINKALVKMTVDDNFYLRRKGLLHYSYYMKFLRNVFKINFINIYEFIILLLIKLIIIMLPKILFKNFYRYFLRSH